MAQRGPLIVPKECSWVLCLHVEIRFVWEILLLGLLMLVAIVVLETDVVAYMNNKRFVTRGKGHRTASLYELLK